MTASFSQAAETSTAGEQIRSMRTGVLIHPETARDGRFLLLPHPRTTVPTYFLHSENSGSSTSSEAGLGELFELSTLKDAKYDRTWMISGLNQVISSGQLEILSKVDVRFLVISLLYCALSDGKFRSHEDTFDQIALALHSKRRAEMFESIPELKAKLNEKGAIDGDESGGVQQEWTDILTFGNLPLVKAALEEIADVQNLPNGEQAYRLSLPKVFTILDSKHERISLKSTFVAAPNTLGRSFERRWPLESDPSAYLTEATSGGEATGDCKEAKDLRRRIAAEIVATNLPPQLAAEYFSHLEIAVEK